MRRLASCAGLAALVLALPAAAADLAETTAGGVYAPAQAEHGLEIYADHCVACHAEGMKGGPGAPPLIGASFKAGWEGETVGSLLDYLRTTMPTGQAGALKDQEYADVLAAVLQANGYPPSSNGGEIATDPAALENVTIGGE